MNKQGLVASVAERTGLTAAEAGKAVEAILDALTGSLAEGEKIRLAGFGTFAVTRRAASAGRNPRTGEAIQIPSVNQPKFRASKQLKAAVQSEDFGGAFAEADADEPAEEAEEAEADLDGDPFTDP